MLCALLTNCHFLGVERGVIQPPSFCVSLMAFGFCKIKGAPAFFFLMLFFSRKSCFGGSYL